MKAVGWSLGCGATLLLLMCLAGVIAIAGGTPFSPGPLSTEHPQNQPISNFAAHADFERRCELCHTPFIGPDAALCSRCHTDVGDQITGRKGLHGRLGNAQDCAHCHTDHKGREAGLTRAMLAEIPHNQFGFTLVAHQRDYNGKAMTCRSCHTISTPDKKADAAAVQAACMDCHKNKDAKFMADHRRQMGDACAVCHDGSNQMQGFDHAKFFPLTGKHQQVACAKCHVNNNYRTIARDCVSCHPDPQMHRGQFGTECAACHTAAAWRPARLFMHSFPLNHGNKGKESACAVCHPTNYATDTCYGCHEHTPANIAAAHLKANLRDYQNCVKCHPTGKKRE